MEIEWNRRSIAKTWLNNINIMITCVVYVLGANPFVKNKHARTALQLAMIENASPHLYIPWVMSFDQYGYYADELRVLNPH